MSLNIAAIPSPFIHSSIKRRKNTWYTVASGNWTDPNIWMSNALTPSSNIQNQYPGQGSATYIYPRIGDDVYVGLGHTVSLNTAFTVNNLVVAGMIQTTGNHILIINGDIQVTGNIDLTNGGIFNLYGVNNYINNFIAGSSTFVYRRIGDQPIMNLLYNHLQTASLGTKYATSNLTVNGNLTVFVGGVPFAAANVGTMELGSYNLTVNGSTSIFDKLSKTGGGNVLFVGPVVVNNTIQFALDFSTGNPTVECRGGLSTGQSINNINTWKTGTGTWKFTTNNQTISGGGVWPFSGDVLISGAITLSIAGAVNFGVVNGDNVNSKLLVSGTIQLFSTTTPMATGIFDYLTNSTSTLGYYQSGSYTLPYTTYNNLTVGTNSSTKTLGGNTVVNGNLATPANISVTLELATYNLTVNGTTSISALGTISKTGAGNLVFVGTVFTSSGSLLSLSGNPSVELRNGLSVAFSNTNVIVSGSGTWTLSTNNQTFAIGVATTIQNILISGAITVTNMNAGINSGYLICTYLNGNNAASTFDGRNAVNYMGADVPMGTGILQANAAVNTFTYSLNGNQNIKGGTYRTLVLSGGGVKTLQGNVSVVDTYQLQPPATLNTNSYTLTNP